jgi:lysophospholipase
MKIFATVENPAPDGAVCHDVIASDGVHIRAIVARPFKAAATIFVLNGRADFSERYFETLKELMVRGFAVVTFDWRGQGGSQRLLRDPMRSYVKNFADYDKDLEAVVELARRLDFPEPFYALAHSTGGHNLLRALREKTYFERAIVSAPLLGLHFRGWPKPVVHILNFLTKISFLDWLYLPGLPRGPMKRSQFEGNPLTSDRVRWNRDMTTIENFPQLSLGAPTFGWLRATLKSLAELHRWPKKSGPTCPTMIIMAGQDKVVNNAGTRHFAERVPGISLLTIASSRHEILMENNQIREKFWAAFDSFMGIAIKPR